MYIIIIIIKKKKKSVVMGPTQVTMGSLRRQYQWL